MPTLEQIRAARALLGWSQKDLADRAGLSQTGIARIENGSHKPNSATIEKIAAAFDRADIEFLGTRGVEKRANSFETWEGQSGLHRFLDDVYETLAVQGGGFCVFNASPQKWVDFMAEDKWRIHKERMEAIKDKIMGKIIIQRNDMHFWAHDYAEYRWFSGNDYDENKTLYSYGDRLAFLDFGEQSLVITVMKRAEFAQGFRSLFDAAWQQALRPDQTKERV